MSNISLLYDARCTYQRFNVYLYIEKKNERLTIFFHQCPFQNDYKDPADDHYEATETVRKILKKQLLTTDLFQQTFLSTILTALDNHTVNNDSMLYL